MEKLILEMESFRKKGSKTVSLTMLEYLMMIETTTALPDEVGI